MFTVHDSIPLSLHLQERSLVSHMAAWVEGGEHDTQVKHAAETAHKDARYQTTQDVGMFEYSPEISSDPVFLATIKGL